MIDKKDADAVSFIDRRADGADLAAALKDHVMDRIGKWKYPRWVEIIAELRETATGTIQRFKLRGP